MHKVFNVSKKKKTLLRFAYNSPPVIFFDYFPNILFMKVLKNVKIES